MSLPTATWTIFSCSVLGTFSLQLSDILLFMVGVAETFLNNTLLKSFSLVLAELFTQNSFSVAFALL